MDPSRFRAYDSTMTKKKQAKLRTKPTLHGGEGDTTIRAIRVPNDQYAQWQLAAEKQGVKLSEFIRETVQRRVVNLLGREK